MIEGLFRFGNEYVLIKVSGNSVLFGNTIFGARMADISGLKLNYVGVCREFPDLENKDNWKEEAIKRFKDKIKSYETEDEIMDYIINDLRKFGYVLVRTQKGGHRPKYV